MFPSRIDARVSADQRRQVEGRVPASLLQRVADAVPELGEVQTQLAFFRDEQGRCRVTGQVEAELQLQCQRCMQSYPTRIETEVDAVVVWSDEQARNLPAALDPWQVDDLLDLGEALEDELLLALPSMPLHPEAECRGATHYSTDTAAEVVVETHKPFAGLRQLRSNTENET